ncbi:glycoside hydrolase family 43 protein [Streptomyces cocklensis]|uniref:Beta-xylosidase n=1 Tax=Actinacidiphila cocklensis TaxID=887465 RepID=A0A9W4DUR2_9ACTN|nr:glycoside hydrolase family 43 protein [Actinacidiphila cocklensis]MDD1059924.1 glycoside hydrolase family 43 protein [Actinacidiphila cocklensis]WSX72783.1 glycoside hydrolase family 43 protein [Streptomyces sp. NBC_00899]WSX81149.1 glycoside hydrolase family 43 protein [Streptomyces sp. NBC_00899]CAG6395877.1 Beta-xylosidase [Actinacidiphila cocklensis]
MRTYDNPVISGFHPDPSVCRVGEDYYAVCSSFEYFPGVPLFHSRDLVHWQQIGNVLDRAGQLDLTDRTPSSRGIYAPTIRHHDGLFYVITSRVGAGGIPGGHLIVTSEQPAGPWSDPVHVDLPGVDPDLFWDDEGGCWCTFSGIRTARIDPSTGAVLEGPWQTWSGSGGQYPEAPHLFRIDGWWYLLVSEGGTGDGHAVSIARGRSPRGPFEPCPSNPFLSHRGSSLPIQSTGHADLVQAADGTWWLIMLGTRPHGAFPRFHVMGREMFLAPVSWEDGWPVAGPVQPRHPAPAAWHPLPLETVRDDFDTQVLAPRWVTPRSRPETSWSLHDRPGWLTLHATGSTLDRPGHTFIGRRQQHLDGRTSARLDPGAGRGGLCVRMDEAHHYEIEVGGGEVSVVARIGPLRQTVARRPVPSGPLTLVVETRTTEVLPPSVISADQVDDGPIGTEAGGPDTIVFSVVGSDAEPLAELDGRYLSTQLSTGFTGRVIGMYAIEGSVAFDWFDHRPCVRG